MTWQLLPLKASHLHHCICIHVGFLASTQCEAYFTSLMSPSAGSCGRHAAQLKRAALCLPPCPDVLGTVLPALCCFAYMATADLGLGRIEQGRAGQAKPIALKHSRSSSVDMTCPALCCFAYMALADLGLGRAGQGRAGQGRPGQARPNPLH